VTQNSDSPAVFEILTVNLLTVSRRADPGVVVANRAAIPQRGQLSVILNSPFQTSRELHLF
jgi:hypothetical protein